MKKVVLLLAVLFISLNYSCNSDENVEETQDDIINIWTLNYSKKADIVIVLTDCRKETSYEIKPNGEFVFLSKYLTDGECTIYETINGTWESLGDKKYKFNMVFDNDSWSENAEITNDGLRFELDDEIEIYIKQN